MTLVDLIKALKEELKHGSGDRELRPDVTVQLVLSSYPPEPPAPVVVKVSSGSTNRRTGQAPTAGSAPSTSDTITPPRISSTSSAKLKVT